MKNLHILFINLFSRYLINQFDLLFSLLTSFHNDFYYSDNVNGHIDTKNGSKYDQ